MRDVGSLIALFHEHGKRVTPQRERIFSVLRACAADHATVDSVCQIIRRDLPTVSLRTVYQVLHDLEDLGEIRLTRLGGDTLRVEDPAGCHAHLHCRQCDSVRAVGIDLPGIEAAALDTRDFTIEWTELVFLGLCARCAPPQDGPPRSPR